MGAEHPALQTARLVLCRWESRHLGALATMHADEEVMRYFPSTLAHEDFDHPALADGHPLARHGLYRNTRHEWTAEPR
jgi:hypothetical protein